MAASKLCFHFKVLQNLFHITAIGSFPDATPTEDGRMDFLLPFVMFCPNVLETSNSAEHLCICLVLSLCITVCFQCSNSGTRGSPSCQPDRMTARILLLRSGYSTTTRLINTTKIEHLIGSNTRESNSMRVSLVQSIARSVYESCLEIMKNFKSRRAQSIADAATRGFRIGSILLDWVSLNGRLVLSMRYLGIKVKNDVKHENINILLCFLGYQGYAVRLAKILTWKYL